MLIAGVDESGGGDCIAGPLIAAACVYDLKKDVPEDIRSLSDTKRILKRKGEKGIEKKFWRIVETCADWKVGSVNARFITLFREGGKYYTVAIQKALCYLDPQPIHVLVDGDIPLPSPESVGYSYLQQAKVKGDEAFWIVAAASIVARFMRVSLMQEIAAHSSVEMYGWHRNFGRATPEHIRAIENHGVTDYHRKHYAAVRKADAVHQLRRGAWQI